MSFFHKDHPIWQASHPIWTVAIIGAAALGSMTLARFGTASSFDSGEMLNGLLTSSMTGGALLYRQRRINGHHESK